MTHTFRLARHISGEKYVVALDSTGEVRGVVGPLEKADPTTDLPEHYAANVEADDVGWFNGEVVRGDMHYVDPPEEG